MSANDRNVQKLCSNCRYNTDNGHVDAMLVKMAGCGYIDCQRGIRRTDAIENGYFCFAPMEKRKLTQKGLEYYTFQEVAAMIYVSPSHVHNLIKRGVDIPRVRAGNKTIFPKTEFDEWKEKYLESKRNYQKGSRKIRAICASGANGRRDREHEEAEEAGQA